MNQPVAVWEDDLFTKIFHRDLVNKHMDEEQRNKYSYFENLFFKAFQHAKKKDFENSLLLFNQGEAELLTIPKHGLYGNLLYETNYPKKAYYYYKTGKFKPSLLLTHKTIIINELLKNSFNAHFLVFVQVQQYHNISRILYTMRDFKASMRLSYDLLLFLLLDQQTSFKSLTSIIHHDESEKSLLKCGMSYQILFDILVSINSKTAGSEKAEIIALLAKLAKQISIDFDPANEQERTLKDFLKLLVLLDLNGLSEYEYRVNEFLTMNADLFPSTDKVLKLFLKSA